MNNPVPHISHVAKAIGLRGAWSYFMANRRLPVYPMRPRQVPQGVWARSGTTDRAVFYQTFVDEPLAAIGRGRDVRCVVDCGANAGYTAAYLLARYPRCRLIAVEADSRNVEVLKRNVEPFGDRVQVVHAGIWSHQTGLVVERGTYRMGGEDSTIVREARPGEQADLDAIDLSSLMEKFGLDHIDLLKIDIERAERAVFARNFEGWLPKVDTIAIELHDDECTGVFSAAVSKETFSISHRGELTIAHRKGAGPL